jgi:hypothetical protein
VGVELRRDVSNDNQRTGCLRAKGKRLCGSLKIVKQRRNFANTESGAVSKSFTLVFDLLRHNHVQAGLEPALPPLLKNRSIIFSLKR